MSTTTKVVASDGTGLLLRSWESSEAPRAAVVIVHGLGEHSGRYEHVGYTCAHDHNDSGGSSGY